MMTRSHPSPAFPSSRRTLLKSAAAAGLTALTL